jgi:hypothetical protein
MIKDVTRDIKDKVKYELWWRAGGRCQFSGHNKALWKSSVTQELVNIAQMAHIYSFSEHGPRGRGPYKSNPKNINSIVNLMLTCHECHRKIDKKKDGGRYTPQLLRAWKQEHRKRIERVTGIDPSKKSHVLHYKSRIGDFLPDWEDSESFVAMFPKRYPAEDHPIDLSMKASHKDSTKSFWQVEAENLKTEFQRKITERIEGGSIKHLSVFAMASQPLLIYLGSLLGNIHPVEIYQRHRRPEQSWEWPKNAVAINFKIKKPRSKSGKKVALLIALSADINQDEIIEAMKGETVDIWKIFIDNPSVHYMRSRKSLGVFYKTIGDFYDEIKNKYGVDVEIHLFPVMSNACAIETGRAIMPKARLPITIYDKCNIGDRKIFQPTLKI